MTVRERALAGTMSWVDLQTPDLDKAKRFYGELLGWSFQGGDDPKMGFYVMAQVNGRNVAGMAKLGPNSPFPPMWSVYFASDNADETAKKAKEAGAKIIAPPMDVADQGRMAYFQDPAGAYVGIWQGKKHQGAQLLNETGAMCWEETYSRDVKASRDFYAKVFGLSVKPLNAPGIDYATLQKGEEIICGTMQMPDHFPKEMPSHWTVYFAVADPDAAVNRAKALSGTVISPAFDSPFGRLAFLADPFGARFCVMKPSR